MSVDPSGLASITVHFDVKDSDFYWDDTEASITGELKVFNRNGTVTHDGGTHKVNTDEISWGSSWDDPGQNGGWSFTLQADCGEGNKPGIIATYSAVGTEGDSPFRENAVSTFVAGGTIGGGVAGGILGAPGGIPGGALGAVGGGALGSGIGWGLGEAVGGVAEFFFDDEASYVFRRSFLICCQGNGLSITPLQTQLIFDTDDTEIKPVVYKPVIVNP